MPLSGHVGAISGRLEVLAPPPPLLALLFGRVVDRVSVPDESSGVQHRSAGNTDRTAPRSHVVGVRERRSAPGKPIQVWRFNLVFPSALIVSKHWSSAKMNTMLGRSLSFSRTAMADNSTEQDRQQAGVTKHTDSRCEKGDLVFSQSLTEQINLVDVADTNRPGFPRRSGT